jgi:hypothetical protein
MIRNLCRNFLRQPSLHRHSDACRFKKSRPLRGRWVEAPHDLHLSTDTIQNWSAIRHYALFSGEVQTNQRACQLDNERGMDGR